MPLAISLSPKLMLAAFDIPLSWGEPLSAPRREIRTPAIHRVTPRSRDQIQGRSEQLIGSIQERYDVARDEAERQFDAWTAQSASTRLRRRFQISRPALVPRVCDVGTLARSSFDMQPPHVDLSTRYRRSCRRSMSL